MAHGHGLWIWRLDRMTPRDLDTIEKLRPSILYLKALDGKTEGLAWKEQCAHPWVARMRAAGTRLAAWGYHYGHEDGDAVRRAVDGLLSSGFDEYIFDIEEGAEARDFGRIAEAVVACAKDHGNAALGVTSHMLPSAHASIPYRALAEHAAAAYPQIYCMEEDTSTAAELYARSVAEYGALFRAVRPVLNTMAEGGGRIAPENIRAFMLKNPETSLFRAPQGAEENCVLLPLLWRPN